MLNRLKLVLPAALLVVVLATSTGLNALADVVGYVDSNKLQGSSDKSQALVADINSRKADLRKIEADYAKQIQDARKANAKNPVATKGLEQQLQAQYEAKVKEFANWQKTRMESYATEIDNAIKTVAQRKGVNVVVDSQAIYFGGVDLTNDVITSLNTGK
jgi:Skp family chaperone for outer membrane proteins